MADFFTEQYQKDNPVPTPQSSGSIGTSDNDFFAQQYQKDNPTIASKAQPLPGMSKQNSIIDYVAAPFKGMQEQAQSALPSNILSPQQGLYNMNTEQGAPFDTQYKPGAPNLPQAEPIAKPKDQLEAGLRGAGSAITPAVLVGGPEAALGSVIGNSIIDWRNAASPNTPGWNNALGLVAGLLPYSSASKVFGGNNALTSAWKDLGINSSTAAGIGEDKSFTRTIRGLRESPFSDAINQAEGKSREQITNKVNELADTLGASSTKDEAGSVVRQQLGEVKGGKPVAPLPGETNWLYTNEKDLAARNLALNNQVNPQTTLVDISSLVPDLRKSIQAPAGAFTMDSGAEGFVSKLQDSINSYGMGTAGYIPLDAVQYLKRNVSDQLSAGLFSMSDTSERNLMTIWSKLSDVEKQAYAGTPYESTFNDLQKDWSQYFQNRNYVKNLITEGQSGGETLNKLLTNSGSTGDRLNRVFELIPEARGEVASYYLRNLGMNTKGDFSPDTFFKNWSNERKLSPEAKQALFGDIDGDLPKEYDQLALVAKEQARSEAARNYSGTAGTYELLRFVRNFTRNVAVYGGLPAIGAGASTLYQSGNENEAAKEAGFAGLAGYGTAMLLGPKLMSFGPFVRLLARDPPIQSSPLLLRAFAVEYPQVAPEVTALSNYITTSSQAPQDASHFLQGGYSGWPEQTGYAEGGPADTLYPESKNINSLIDNFIANNPSIYMQGGNKNPIPSLKMPALTDGPDPDDKASKLGHPQKMAGGGPTDEYNTKLSNKEEQDFQKWKQRNAPNDSGVDYDLRGAYKAGLNPAENGHWSDEFKKPNHPTFSNESKYSRENPNLPAGSWEGEHFFPPTSYALGGLTHTPTGTVKTGHSNKFKGKHIEGYAEGGPTNIPNLDELENNEDVGVLRRQSVPEESLIDQIMQKYKLGSTGQNDAKSYAQELRWFEGLKQGAHEPEMANGGPTTKIYSGNDNVDPKGADYWKDKKVQPLGMMKNPPSPAIIDTIMKNIPKPANDYAEGGSVETNENNHPGSNIIDMFMAQGRIPIGGGHGGGIKSPKGSTSYGDSINVFGPTEGGELKKGEMVGDLIKNGEPYATWSKTPDVMMPNTGMNSNDNVPWFNRAEGGYIEDSAMGYDNGGDVTNRIIGNESSHDPNAKNPRSSASGPGQFLDRTWVNMMQKYHPEIANPLAYKKDVNLSTEMTDKYRQENSAYLQAHNLPVDAGTVYLAHFLGPQGALKVLTSNPNTPVASLFDKAVTSANPQIKNMTSAQLVSMINRKMGDGKASPEGSQFAGHTEGTTEKQPSIIDTLMAQQEEEQPEEDTSMNNIKQAIQSAPWIEPLTKAASNTILKNA